jgi:hypothetical protein
MWIYTSTPPYPYTEYFFLLLLCSHFWSIGLISQFLDHSQTVGLLGRVISSSQGLYLNTEQHKHRKTHTHINHPRPEWDSNPRSRPPSERSSTCLRRRDNFTFFTLLKYIHIKCCSIFTYTASVLSTLLSPERRKCSNTPPPVTLG